MSLPFEKPPEGILVIVRLLQRAALVFDLLACEQVKHEGCTLQEADDDEDAFWRLLERK